MTSAGRLIDLPHVERSDRSLFQLKEATMKDVECNGQLD